MIVGDKRFDLPYGGALPVEEIKAWFDNLYLGRDKCSIEVVVSTEKRTRKGAAAAGNELVRLKAQWGKEGKSFKEGDYDFDFAKGRFLWKGEELYITQAEALFLYNCLALRTGAEKRQSYYVYNMRRKFGKDFLKDIVIEEENDIDSPNFDPATFNPRAPSRKEKQEMKEKQEAGQIDPMTFDPRAKKKGGKK